MNTKVTVLMQALAYYLTTLMGKTVTYEAVYGALSYHLSRANPNKVDAIKALRALAAWDVYTSDDFYWPQHLPAGDGGSYSYHEWQKVVIAAVCHSQKGRSKMDLATAVRWVNTIWANYDFPTPLDK